MQRRHSLYTQFKKPPLLTRPTGALHRSLTCHRGDISSIYPSINLLHIIQQTVFLTDELRFQRNSKGLFPRTPAQSQLCVFCRTNQSPPSFLISAYFAFFKSRANASTPIPTIVLAFSTLNSCFENATLAIPNSLLVGTSR